MSRQHYGGDVEVLVCDSRSTDGSREVAEARGATVIQIPPAEFSHGGTRNLLMRCARGTHVAFLTQDAEPADDLWLSRLVARFDAAPDVALTFGPYRPRPGASPMVARELTAWFEGFSPDGTQRIDRLSPDERDAPAAALLGPRGYFTDANGCVARAAWERVPFREVDYAEDHALAHDMLRAGFAKVFVPDAAVQHSHDYSNLEWLRRSFDEARALHELYGYVEPLDPRQTILKLRGLTGADWRWAASQPGAAPPLTLLPRSLAHHAARLTGAILGSRADRLPPRLTTRLSLERRS